MREALLFLQGDVKRWELLERLFDNVAIRIVSVWSSKAAKQMQRDILFNRKKREWAGKDDE